MKFDVPIMFNAEVVHKGKRLAVQEEQVEWVAVDVEEATDLEAPTATAWTRADGTRMSTRWHREAHWIPYEYSDEDGGPHRIDADGLRQRLLRGNRHQNPLAEGTEHVLMDFAAGRRAAFDPSAFRSVGVTDRNHTIAKARLKAAKTLVVDGQVWVRESEPAYAISRQHGRIDMAARPRTIRPDVVFVSRASDPKDMFRADRFEDMAAEVDGRYKQQVAVDRSAMIEVYIPDSIRYDDEGTAFRAAAEGVAASQRQFLKTAKLPDVRRWLGLAEAAEAAKTEWNEETACALETAAEAYANAESDDGDWYTETIRKALSRWRMRPIGDALDGLAGPNLF